MSNQRILLAIIALIIVLPFVLASCSKKLSADALQQTQFKDLAGEPFQLAFQQKYLLINFWATWCLPCVEELPELSALHDELQNPQLEFAGISIDDSEKTKKFFVANELTSFKILTSESDTMALSEQLGNDKSVVPYTIVVDPQGKIIKKIFGRVDIAQLKSFLTSLPADSAK